MNTHKNRRIGKNLEQQLPVARKFGKQGRFGLLNFTMDMVTGYRRPELPIDSGFNSSWRDGYADLDMSDLDIGDLEINGRTLEV